MLTVLVSTRQYEGKSISNQPIQTPKIFMPCFNTCFKPEGKNAPVSCHSLIRYWMSNMASDAKVSFSSKVEYRAVIRYLYLKGKTGREIHCELTNVYGSSAPSYAQVEFWVWEFKRSRTSLEDETRFARPSDATDEEMCNKVRDLVYSDRRIEVEEITNAVYILHVSVSTTLHDRLDMHKLTARWVPKSLSDERMATRASVYSALLKRFKSKKDDFLSRLVTVDETWVHYYEPENKTQSRQRVRPGSPRPKKFKTQSSAGKVMATVFWDAQGVIMLDFLAKKSTIKVAYNANLLDQLRTVIREKRRGKFSKGILLQKDNARVHTCKIAMDAVERNEYELLPHPAFAPRPISFSQTWKKDIHGRHFGPTKKSWRKLRSGSETKTLASSVLGWWHWNTVGQSALF